LRCTPSYDRAFDRGYLTFDENLRVILSPQLQIENPPPLHTATLLSLEGRPLTLPDRFPPDREALAWHREVVFREG
jgi:predicted restriction endonuclease